MNLNIKQKKYSKREMVVIDDMAYIIGVLGNVAVIPQIIKSWSGPTPGVAILTWMLFVLFGVIWLLYAVVHRQKPLIFAQIVGLSCNILVVVGWLLHNR